MDSHNLSFHKTLVFHLYKQTFYQCERTFRSCACNTFGQQVIYNREFLLNNKSHTFGYLGTEIVQWFPVMGFQIDDISLSSASDLIGGGAYQIIQNLETQLSNFRWPCSFDSRGPRCSYGFCFSRVNFTIRMARFSALCLSRRPFWAKWWLT